MMCVCKGEREEEYNIVAYDWGSVFPNWRENNLSFSHDLEVNL